MGFRAKDSSLIRVTREFLTRRRSLQDVAAHSDSKGVNGNYMRTLQVIKGLRRSAALEVLNQHFRFKGFLDGKMEH